MVTTKPSNKNLSKCSICGAKLSTFAAYIPGKGESCMRCYKEAAEKAETVR